MMVRATTQSQTRTILEALSLAEELMQYQQRN